jgi:hypothetical protein
MSCDSCPRLVNGWFRGCLAATTILGALPVIAVILSLPYRGFQENLGVIAALFVLPLTLILICLPSGMPAALVILLGESLRIRSVLFYAAVGAAIGALISEFIVGAIHPLSLLFGLAGCLAGVAYWSVAGRHAGDGGAG